MRTRVTYVKLPNKKWIWVLDRGSLHLDSFKNFSDKRSAKRNFKSVQNAFKGTPVEYTKDGNP